MTSPTQWFGYYEIYMYMFKITISATEYNKVLLL